MVPINNSPLLNEPVKTSSTPMRNGPAKVRRIVFTLPRQITKIIIFNLTTIFSVLFHSIHRCWTDSSLSLLYTGIRASICNFVWVVVLRGVTPILIGYYIKLPVYIINSKYLIISILYNIIDKLMSFLLFYCWMVAVVTCIIDIQ